MRRSTRITIISAVGLAAALTVVIIVSTVVTHLPDEPPARDRLPEQALTPEEMTLSVQPQTDGTLHVSERLIFDVPEGRSMPLTWYIGKEPIGWERGVGEGAQYFVLPRASEVSAGELSTSEDSTKDDPTEIADLTVTRDEVDDPARDSIGYEFTDPNRTDGDRQWSAGRHAVDISYVLDDVYLDVGGDELFVLPLRFPDGTSEAESIRTISLESGGPIQCLPDNTAFDPDSDCSRLHEHRLDRNGTRLMWRNEESANLNAVGFAAPNGIEAEPITAHQEGWG